MTSWPSRAPARSRAGAKRAHPDGSIVGTVPYLVVLVCTAAGVYISWHLGSAGGGKGGVIGGAALLVAAVIRLVLPARFAGLLGTRNRVTDVLTLAIFGTGLLWAGLVLPPALGRYPHKEIGAPATERESRSQCRKLRWPIPSPNLTATR